MLRRFRLKLSCKLLIIYFVIFSAVCAHADFRTEDALASCPENSIYAVLSLEDAGGLFKWALSETNLMLLAPIAEMKAEDIAMINSIVTRIPCSGAAALIGVDSKGMPFFKASFSFNAEYRPILDLIARGEAAPEDLKKLILGDNSPLAPMAEGTIKVEYDKKFPGILRVNNEIFMGARENLLIAASTPSAVKAGMAAASNPAFRLKLNRRLNSENFIFIHADIDTIIKHINRRIRTRRMVNPAVLRLLDKMFAAPVNIETDFELTQDKFKIYNFINLDEALSDEAYSELNINTPATGGHIDLNIAETPMLAFGTKININLLKKLAEIQGPVRELINNLDKNGVSNNLFFDLMDGALTLNLGGNFVSMGLFKLPAFYLSKTGKNGAAADFIAKVPKGSGTAVKSDGWENLFKAPVTVSPVPFYIGNWGESLFLGVFEPDLINKESAQNFKPEFKDLISKKSLMSFYIDFEIMQNYLKREIGGALKFMAVIAGDQDKIEKLKNLLEAKLSITSITAYAPAYGEYVTEFSLKEVSPEEGLWSKIISILK